MYRNPQTIEQLPYMCTFDSHYGKDPTCGFLSDPNSVGKWATFSAGGTPVAGTGPPEAGNNGQYTEIMITVLLFIYANTVK